MSVPAPLTAAATTVCTLYGLTLNDHFTLEADGDYIIRTVNKRHSVMGSVSALAIESVAEAAFTAAAEQLGIQAVQADADTVGDCQVAIGHVDLATGSLDQRVAAWKSETLTPTSINQQTTIYADGISVADHAIGRIATKSPVYASVGPSPNALTDINRILVPANSTAFLILCGTWKAAIVSA